MHAKLVKYEPKMNILTLQPIYLQLVHCLAVLIKNGMRFLSIPVSKQAIVQFKLMDYHYWNWIEKVGLH